MKEIPLFLEKYFWDVEFSGLKKEKHWQFIIERILEYGDKRAVRWMRKNFSTIKIERVVYKSRNLSKKSANFWSFVLNLNKDKVLCLKQLFPEPAKAIWRF